MDLPIDSMVIFHSFLYVLTQLLKLTIEIVDLPIDSMVDLSIVFCKRLPEATPSSHPFLWMGFPMKSTIQRAWDYWDTP